MDNHLNSGVFIILFIQLSIFTIMYVVMAKKLTRYLETHHAEEFKKRRIPQAWTGSKKYFTLRNFMKLHALPYLIFFTSFAELDSVSTTMVKRIRFAVAMQVILFVIVVLSI